MEEGAKERTKRFDAALLALKEDITEVKQHQEKSDSAVDKLRESLHGRINKILYISFAGTFGIITTLIVVVYNQVVN